MMDLPSSDQASSEGPALIPIVGNNTERGGESVFTNQYLFTFHIQISIRDFTKWNLCVNATVLKTISIYPVNL